MKYYTPNNQLNPIELAGWLFNIHEHAEGLFEENPEQIVYREKDIIELLKKLGYPEPDFEGYDKQCQKELLSCPGDTIKESLLEMGISKAEFTKKLKGTFDVHAKWFWNLEHVNELLEGKLEIGDYIAEDLERVLGVPKHFWLERERLYREKLEGLK